MMNLRQFGAALAVLVVTVVATAAIAAAGPPAAVEPQLVDDSGLKALSTTEGGGTVLPTTRTVPHWSSSATDPSNGVTYGYTMVGADPSSCAASACDVTVQVDVTPIVVNIGGWTFDGASVVDATLQSPQFATNDYASTTSVTGDTSTFAVGQGGTLSSGDRGLPLELEDATMRAQFNKTGSSLYHLRLTPHVMPAVTIDVPRNQGGLLVSGRGVVGASIDIGWWSSQIKNLEAAADPTHLALYLTDNVFLHLGKDVTTCCVTGYHGTKAAGNGAGSAGSNGNAPVQTFAWASYIRPGFYSWPNGTRNWALQDIHAISHEIAEWADDPFADNVVKPWFAATAPQYGCVSLLEAGDPVFGIGFAMGTNAWFQGPTPTGVKGTADGSYHPEDEVYLPWFMRTAPNTVSEPTQSRSANIGRYSLLGDLNPAPGFRVPATGC